MPSNSVLCDFEPTQLPNALSNKKQNSSNPFWHALKLAGWSLDKSEFRNYNTFVKKFECWKTLSVHKRQKFASPLELNLWSLLWWWRNYKWNSFPHESNYSEDFDVVWPLKYWVSYFSSWFDGKKFGPTHRIATFWA